MTANMPTQLLTMLVQKYSRRTSIIYTEWRKGGKMDTRFIWQYKKTLQWRI